MGSGRALTAGAWVLAAVTVIGAAAALTAWILSELELVDSSVQLVDLARDTPTALIVAFVVVFLAINPLVEEIAYRNVAYRPRVPVRPHRSRSCSRPSRSARCMWWASRPARRVWGCRFSTA